MAKTKYTEELKDRICGLLSSDSYTIAEICKIVGISDRSYYDWQSNNADFAQSIKKATDRFNEYIVAQAKRSLSKMVTGYTIQEKHTVSVDSGKRDENDKPIVKVKEHKVVEKHIQPNVAAIIFTLVNKDPQNWQNKQNTDITTNGNELKPISIETAKKVLDELQDYGD